MQPILGPGVEIRQVSLASRQQDPVPLVVLSTGCAWGYWVPMRKWLKLADAAHDTTSFLRITPGSVAHGEAYFVKGAIQWWSGVIAHGWITSFVGEGPSLLLHTWSGSCLGYGLASGLCSGSLPEPLRAGDHKFSRRSADHKLSLSLITCSYCVCLQV